MEKTVTFGKLLTLVVIMAIPFSYWVFSIENRVGNTEENYDVLSTKVLDAIEIVQETLHELEHGLETKDSLNYYIRHDNASKR